MPTQQCRQGQHLGKRRQQWQAAPRLLQHPKSVVGMLESQMPKQLCSSSSSAEA